MFEFNNNRVFKSMYNLHFKGQPEPKMLQKLPKITIQICPGGATSPPYVIQKMRNLIFKFQIYVILGCVKALKYNLVVGTLPDKDAFFG